jgi:hypothetical protein
MRARSLLVVLLATQSLGLGCSDRSASVSAPAPLPASAAIAARDAASLVARAGFSARPLGAGAFAVERARFADEPVRFVLAEVGGARVEIVGEELAHVSRVDESGLAVFTGAAAGADVVHAEAGERFEELRVVRTPAPTIRARWIVRFPADRLSGRVREGHVELVDRAGAVRFASAPMFAVDARGLSRALSLRALDAAPGSLRFEATLDAADLAFPVVVDPSWSPVAAMSGGHRFHTATRTKGGRVLVVGGNRNGALVAEIYDPAANLWKATATPKFAHFTGHTATALTDGRVLVAYGTLTSGAMTNGAEIYDPTADTWTDVTSSSSANSPRTDHTATSLPDGRVLLAGGTIASTTSSANVPGELTSLFDPAAAAGATWRHAVFALGGRQGFLSQPRANHAAALLPDGSVLLFGGESLDAAGAVLTVGNAELFSAAAFLSSSLTATGDPRASHQAIPLAAGKVLFAGGVDAAGTPTASTQLYDGKSFSNGPTLTSMRHGSALALLPSGGALIAGGQLVGFGAFLSSSEAYDPVKGSFVAAPPLSWSGNGMAATLLADQRVLVTGGGTTGGGGLYREEKFASVLALSPSAASCGSGVDCVSGFCVDGVCCDAACAGQCEACNVKGLEGKCSPVVGAPVGGRAACVDGAGDPCKAQTCDGSLRATCSYVGSAVSCAPAKCGGGNAAVAAAACNGAGACAAPTSTKCDPYLCVSASCPAACATTADCVAGAICIGGKCETGRHCSADRTQSIGPDGAQACAPNLCDASSGGCIARCSTSDDCPGGSACDTSSGQCAGAAAGATSSGGCGVASEPSPLAPRGLAALVGAVAALAIGTSRRRRPRR